MAKLQLFSTVEGLVPIWHQFQHQQRPCWRLWGVRWQTGLSSENEINRNWSIPLEHPSFDKMSTTRLFSRSYFSSKKTPKWPRLQSRYVDSGLHAPEHRNSHWRPKTSSFLWKEATGFLATLSLPLNRKPLCICEYRCPCAQRQKPFRCTPLASLMPSNCMSPLQLWPDTARRGNTLRQLCAEI